jgi:hypothetical protein
MGSRDRLVRLVKLRDETDAQLKQAVAAARKDHASWADLAALLHMTKDQAWETYARACGEPGIRKIKEPLN